MSKKFDQYCPMAHALSLVGERWSLLIVRELLHGPKRYTDLTNGLPGIGTNILAARLRDLEQSGIVCKRKLPPPAASTVYELTEYGAGLNEALFALARWGARSLGPPQADDVLYPEWGVNAFPALFDADAAHGLTETWVFEIDDDVFTVRLDNGRMTCAVGGAADADLRIALSVDTFFGLSSGRLEPEEALDRKLVDLTGDRAAFDRVFRVLSLAPRAAVVG